MAGDIESPSSEAQPRAAKSGGSNGHTVSKAKSVTELELQFAQNPESMAFVDLCEAYLDQGRFMEAMVVCKKGIKAHPDAIHARVLLARVYAVQKKYKRALTELDKLANEHPEDGSVFLARGRVRLESQADDDGIADLKKALDLDASLEEASKLLADRDIIYPEPEPEPEPPPPPPPPAMPRAASSVSVTPVSSPSSPTSDSAGTADIGMSSDTADIPSSDPVQPLPRSGPAPAREARARPVSHFGMGPISSAPGGAPLKVMPQKLEGEDELEKIANKVAEEKPDRGRPKTTLILALVCVVFGVGIVAYRLIEKRRIEAIDKATTIGFDAFNRDTYGGYKKAASYFEEIIEDHDDDHPLTLGRLAHTYAILWGEHGEVDLKPKLDDILARAKKDAPQVSHTVAAATLAALYGGADRGDAAGRARMIADPYVKSNSQGGAAPTYADLALALALMELGEYDAARRELGRVKQVLPGSVRAKVLHARAALRARRLGTAVGAFQAALRAEPNHPGALAGLALAQLERGSLNGAAQTLMKFDKMAQAHSKDVSTRDQALAEYARSEILRSQGEEAKATGAYEQAVRLDPKNADFPFGLGRFYLKTDRPKEAIGPLKKAVEMDPGRWSFLVELAEAEMRHGKYNEAKKRIDQALAKAPTYSEALIARARWMRRTKQPDTEKHLKELLEKSPSLRVDVQLELGRHYRKLGRLDDAKKALETAIEAMASYSLEKQGDVLLSYGLLMEDRGEAVTAINSYEKAGQMGVLEGWYRLAYLLQKTRQDRKKALAACQRYLAAGSTLRYSKIAVPLCESLK